MMRRTHFLFIAIAMITGSVVAAGDIQDLRAKVMESPSDQDSITALMEQSKSEDTLTRVHAYVAWAALGRVHGEQLHEVAIPYLIGGLRDEDQAVRKNVAIAIEGFGVHAGLAKSHLIDRIHKEPNTDVASISAKALGHLGGDDAVEALIWIVDTRKRGSVINSALSALGEIGPSAHSALGSVKNRFRSEDPSSVARAIEAYWKIGSADASNRQTVDAKLLEIYVSDGETPQYVVFSAITGIRKTDRYPTNIMCNILMQEARDPFNSSRDIALDLLDRTDCD